MTSFAVLNRWMPDTGGANIPALNELLSEFGIALGDKVSEGYFSMGDHGMYYASGTSLIRFPQSNQSIIIERDLHNQGLEVRRIAFYPLYIHYIIFVSRPTASHRRATEQSETGGAYTGYASDIQSNLSKK